MDIPKIETDLGDITNTYTFPASAPQTAKFCQISHSPESPRSKHPRLFRRVESKKDPKVSRSMGEAMTMLQVKWKNLELQNQRLRDNILSLEKKYFDDKELWKEKVMTEIDESRQVEMRYEKNIRKANIELNKLRGTIAELEEENSFIKSQRMSLRDAPQESVQNSQNFELLKSKFGELHKELESRNDDVKSLEAAIRRTEIQRDEIFNELQESNTHVNNLQDKVSGLESELITMQKATNAMMENHQSSSQVIQDLNEENYQLKGENSTLQECNWNQRGQIESLKAQLEQLGQPVSNQSTLRRNSRPLKRIRTTSSSPKSSTSPTHNHGATTTRNLYSSNNDKKSNQAILKNSKSKSQRNISPALQRDKIKSKDNLKSLISKLKKDIKRCNTNFELISSTRGASKKDLWKPVGVGNRRKKRLSCEAETLSKYLI